MIISRYRNGLLRKKNDRVETTVVIKITVRNHEDGCACSINNNNWPKSDVTRSCGGKN